MCVSGMYTSVMFAIFISEALAGELELKIEWVCVCMRALN